MDIAKYIGLFLLKNNVVYVHGLGNLELKKKPAVYNGEVLEPGTYEVVMTPLGSIDDNLANFIATNEQVSISKASNELREFSAAARADIQNGKKVEIPSIGHFAEERGKTIFIVSPEFQYTPPPLPSIKISRKLDETTFQNTAGLPVSGTGYTGADASSDHSNHTGSISWMKLSIWIIAAVLLVVLVYIGIQSLRQKNLRQEAVPVMPLQELPGTVPAASDTLAAAEHLEDEPITDSTTQIDFDVIINTYPEYNKAKSRTDRLSSFGNTVELVAEEDSSAFYVVMPISGVPVYDTARILDSLRRTFNPSGVSILE